MEAVLGGVIPSLRITEALSTHHDAVTLALRLFIPTRTVLSSDNPVAVSRALLTGLATLRSGEQVIVRSALRPGSPRSRRSPEQPDATARELDAAWRRKTGLPGFSAGGLVLIRASKARARELAGHIESVLRARRGLAGGIRVTSERGNRRLSALPRTSRSSGWLSNLELLPLLGFPLGSEAVPNVEVGSRELLVPRDVPRHGGRRLFIGRDSQGERPVTLDATSARHHMAVCGPSGVGKSVLLARCILDDIEHGFSGAVIDPKADLIDTLLERVPAKHADRIVVLDPGDSRPLPGVALLSGGDPDARADVLTGTLKSIFAGAWGVRSDFYGRLAIRTLSEVPNASLADMGPLFYEEPFRRAAIARLRDPFLISSWQSYESLSAAAQAEHVQAPMARVMTLLSRPRVRAVLASPEPKLDVAQLFAERKWLLVSLAPGAISEAGAALVGAALMYVIWSAIEARVMLKPAKRHPIFLYVDELGTVTNGLPFGFELLAERARGLGAGLTVALQTLGRIPEPTRSALLGNVATFVAFRAAAIEASRIARQLPGLSEADVVAGHVIAVRPVPGVERVFIDETRSPAAVAADPLGVNMLYIIPVLTTSSSGERCGITLTLPARPSRCQRCPPIFSALLLDRSSTGSCDHRVLPRCVASTSSCRSSSRTRFHWCDTGGALLRARRFRVESRSSSGGGSRRPHSVRCLVECCSAMISGRSLSAPERERGEAVSGT